MQEGLRTSSGGLGTSKAILPVFSDAVNYMPDHLFRYILKGIGGARRWYTWVMSTEELLAQVLRLPRTERARLAEEVLSSLEESDEQVAAAWARELERRSREIAEGRVQSVDWGTARAQILKELEQRRAGRSSS